MSGKLAIVAHGHPSVSKGGGELAAYTLFQGVKALGLPAIFVAAVAEADAAQLVLGGEDEHAIFHTPARADMILLHAAPRVSEALLSLLRDERISRVNFHHYLGFGIAALPKVKAALDLPILLTLHEYLAICANHGQMVTRDRQELCTAAGLSACARCFPDLGAPVMATRRDGMLHAFAAIDGFVAPSRFLRDRYHSWGIGRDKLHVIENGIPHAPIPRGLGRRKGRDNPLIFGYFGQLNPFKGLDLLLDAFELLAADPRLSGRYELRLHGNRIGLSPQFEARLDAALADHAPIRAHGRFEQSEVMQLMQDCDAILVPSRWWENSPLVVQEAYAANRPVIAADLGGLAEKVEENLGGLRFLANSSKDLATLLTRLILEGMPAFDNLPLPQSPLDMARGYVQLFDQLEA